MITFNTSTKLNKENNNLRKKVKELLKDNFRCRVNNKFLIYSVIKTSRQFSMSFNQFSKLPNFGSILRYKRELQNIE